MYNLLVINILYIKISQIQQFLMSNIYGQKLSHNGIYHLVTCRFNGRNVQITTPNIYHLFRTSHLYIINVMF